MKKLIFFVLVSSICTSCSMIGGPDGYFPDKKYDFLDEEIQEDIEIPDEMYLPNIENHYPVNNPSKIEETLEIPKPRQIFASSGDSSVQLRRLGELMWIYIETLPSTSWPISKNYWDTSAYEVSRADPLIGEIDIDFNQTSRLLMKVEHGIKEASTEVFLLKVNKATGQIESDPEFIQSQMEIMLDYYADSLSNFSGTSLAAQNLNEMRKAQIFTEDGMTVIALDLNFDRAWSSVSKALDNAEIVTNDRDRSRGLFFVSYAEEVDRRFFGLFGGRNSDQSPNDLKLSEEAQFEISITQENEKSIVRAVSKSGNIEESEKLLSKINESLS